jgi:DNA-binding LytR/AlgR family response regulator
MNATAIIADDEEHLRAHLLTKLLKLWPTLSIVAQASNGLEAKAAIETLAPDIAFLDIKMPGLTGLEVAQQTEGKTRVVFVTAYDQFALEAFEQEAVDFLVKPVDDQRLTKTVQRLQKALQTSAPNPDLASLLKTLLRNEPAAPTRLRWLRASHLDSIIHVPVQDIIYLQSDDKYTIAYTSNAEHVVRMPISELVEALDPEQFWQIHRSTIVNMNFVAGTRRDDTGRLFAQLKANDSKSTKKELIVSRTWLHLFKQM